MSKVIVVVCLLVVLAHCNVIPESLRGLQEADPLLFNLPELSQPSNLQDEGEKVCVEMHWIFALDSSNSMDYDKWERLQSFLEWFKWWLLYWNNYCLQYITAFTFEDRATLPPEDYFDTVNPELFMPEHIYNGNGGTNFGQAIIRGLEFILLHRELSTCWILITDGNAPYPNIEVELFLMVKKYMNTVKHRHVCVLCYHIKESVENPPSNFVQMCESLGASAYSFRQDNFELQMAESLKRESEAELTRMP